MQVIAGTLKFTIHMYFSLNDGTDGRDGLSVLGVRIVVPMI